MITGIRGKTIVQEDGKVRVHLPDLPVGTNVEVHILPIEKIENASEDQDEKCADQKD